MISTRRAAGGKFALAAISYTARFLDDAVSAALPSLNHRERDDLVVALLEREPPPLARLKHS